MKKIKDITIFIENHKKLFILLLTILLILIPMFAAYHFRAYTKDLPQTKNWARDTLMNNIQNQIAQNVDSQFPFLPEEQKRREVNKQVQEFISQNKNSIEQQVKQQAEYFKSRLQDDSGQTYLLAIDPYYYLRRVRNIVEKRSICDEITEKGCWNTHMQAPFGQPMGKDFHSFFEAYTYLFIHALNKDATPMDVAFWIPVLLAVLSVIPAFFIVKKKTGLFGGFIAGMFVATNVAFLGRTPAGFADTDAYNVFFPLLILWLFLEAFQAKKSKNKAILAASGGFATAIYSMAWTGWFFTFDIILATIIGYLIYLFIKYIIERKEDKKDLTFKKDKFFKPLITLGTYLASTIVFITIFRSFHQFISSIFSPFSIGSSITEAARANYWPNVWTTVAELNLGSISHIINVSGGKFLFLLAAFGIVLSITRSISIKKFNTKQHLLLWGSLFIFIILLLDKFIKMNTILYLLIFSIPIVAYILLTIKDDDVDVKYAILLSAWFLASMYAVTKGVRFAFLILPAFAIAIGISFDKIKRIVIDLFVHLGGIKKQWSSIIVVVLLLLLLINPLTAAHKTAINEAPSFNDAWHNSLLKIKTESSPNAIITSWWDFGHWFKYWADRAVTFDGASQGLPAAHWVGKMLLTNDENEALGILRMLDCGANRAYETVLNSTNDSIHSKQIIDSILTLSREDAEQKLKEEGLQDKTIEEVLAYTKCEPPEAYFITSGDMTGKAAVWAHFGSWNFTRAYISKNIKGKDIDTAQKLIENLGFSEQSAFKMYSDLIGFTNEQQVNAWISPWPKYVTGWLHCNAPKDSLVECPVNLAVSKSNQGDTVIDKISFDEGEPNINISIGVYAKGRKVGEGHTTPKVVVIADKYLRTYEDTSTDFNEAIIIRKDISNNQTIYRIMISDPILADSMFTQLYFLDGRYNKRFKLFSQEQSVFGDKILVWKALWSKNE